MQLKFKGQIYLSTERICQVYADKLFQIVGNGPKVYSKDKLLELGYTSPSKGAYLVYRIEPVIERELLGLKWNYKQLEEFKLVMEGKGSLDKNRLEQEKIPRWYVDRCLADVL